MWPNRKIWSLSCNFVKYAYLQIFYVFPLSNEFFLLGLSWRSHEDWPRMVGVGHVCKKRAPLLQVSISNVYIKYGQKKQDQKSTRCDYFKSFQKLKMFKSTLVYLCVLNAYSISIWCPFHVYSLYIQCAFNVHIFKNFFQH